MRISRRSQHKCCCCSVFFLFFKFFSYSIHSNERSHAPTTKVDSIWICCCYCCFHSFIHIEYSSTLSCCSLHYCRETIGILWKVKHRTIWSSCERSVEKRWNIERSGLHKATNSISKWMIFLGHTRYGMCASVLFLLRLNDMCSSIGYFGRSLMRSS